MYTNLSTCNGHAQAAFDLETVNRHFLEYHSMEYAEFPGYGTDAHGFQSGYGSDSSESVEPTVSTRTSSRKSRRKRNQHQQHHQRQAANLRERKRMQSINDAFEGLRAHLPTLPYERRLSKVDTLGLAIKYITFLTDLIQNDRDPNEAAQREKPEPPKKLILQFHRGEYGHVTAVHSLSWCNERELVRNGKVRAKMWRPDDPALGNRRRRSRNGECGEYDPQTDGASEFADDDDDESGGRYSP